VEMRSSCSSPPSRYRSYVLLPRAVFLSEGVGVLTMGTFAPFDYRLLLVGPSSHSCKIVLIR